MSDLKPHEVTWNEVWSKILDLNDHDAVKQELHNYLVIHHTVSNVYSTLTNGAISDPGTEPQAVIDSVEARFNCATLGNLSSDSSADYVGDLLSNL